ncbi:hypothetical protein A2U01_0086203, partial [Trifolium medium]|nr:hypothetical protein [Trifolium medium]
MSETLLEGYYCSSATKPMMKDFQMSLEMLQLACWMTNLSQTILDYPSNNLEFHQTSCLKGQGCSVDIGTK